MTRPGGTIENPMDLARIAELLQPFLSPISNPCHSESGRSPGEACPERSRREPAVLSAAQLQHISTYIDILLHWNARINLTAIRDPEEIVTRHFGESLFAARHLFPSTARVETGDSPVDSGSRPADREGHDFSRADIASERNRALAPERRAIANDQRPPLACPELSEGINDRVADLGSGAGFPGIPIKLWARNIALTLIESNHKKATFLRELARALTLTDINIQNARAETLPPSTFDVVTLRAVERFANILPVAAALLAPSGRLALLISSAQLDTARSTLPQISWETPIPVPRSQSRHLQIGRLEPTK
jgi:16S rRNA (guanine(527)-N(7))-methyltransferase RsmG